jgi:hypothetical protein
LVAEEKSTLCIFFTRGRLLSNFLYFNLIFQFLRALSRYLLLFQQFLHLFPLYFFSFTYLLFILTLCTPRICCFLYKWRKYDDNGVQRVNCISLSKNSILLKINHNGHKMKWNRRFSRNYSLIYDESACAIYFQKKSVLWYRNTEISPHPLHSVLYSLC